MPEDKDEQAARLEVDRLQEKIEALHVHKAAMMMRAHEADCGVLTADEQEAVFQLLLAHVRQKHAGLASPLVD